MARGTRPGPVQAIVGEDSYLAEEALERILGQAVGEDRAEAVQVFYGDESKWEDVLATARTGSLFVPRRAVVVRRADMFVEDRSKKQEDEGAGPGSDEPAPPSSRPTTGRKKRDAPPAEHPLVAYLGDPNPDVTLVLVAAKPDRRRSPWARLLKEVPVHDAAPKKGRALRAHVEEELRRRGLRVSPEAVSDLVDEVGQDLRRLMGEVDKLEAFTGGRREITAEDVSAVVGRGLGRPLYLLSDAFSARDAPRTLELVEGLLDEGEEPLRVLSTLHRSLRQVRGAAALREARVPRAEIGARLLPPNMQFKLDALLEASRRWSDADLRRALRALGRTDRGMKRGADAAAALAAAVVEACRVGAPAGATSPRPGR
jgi:DNA polymerase-3 subunit delta